ncbi:MAG: DUF1634 domain-containing protein [Chloroflexota bacterium]
MAQRQAVAPPTGIAGRLGPAIGWARRGVPAKREALVEAGRLARPGGADRARPIELVISRTLRAGILVASALVALGLVLLLFGAYAGGAHPTLASVLASAEGGQPVLRSPAEVITALGRFEPNALVDLGLLVLIVTPVASLLLSWLQFWLERDYAFVVITSSVLVITAGSLLWGAIR